MRDTRLNPRSEDPGVSLPDPLDGVLRDPVDEKSVPRMWHRIEERRAQRHMPVGVVLGWAMLGAAVAVVVMLGGNFVWERAGHGPLVLRDGSPIVAMDVPDGVRGTAADLADGSRIALDPGTRLEPLVSSAREVVLRLARGRAVFEVTPGGPRRWIIETGLASVEVVGTGFTVDRHEHLVRVTVTHGVVLVRGQRVPDGVARLEAGGSIDVVEGAAERGPPSAPEDSAAPTPEIVPRLPSLPSPPLPPAPASPTGAIPSPTSPWRDAAKLGKYADAYVALGTGGVALETARAASADDLFALADIARISGHAAEAVEPLQRLLAQYASSTRAPLAAVTLGRIELSLGDAGKASIALQRALALGVPAGLEEDVLARLVEADVKSGNRAAARAVAADYARRFPGGRRRADIEQWLRQ